MGKKIMGSTSPINSASSIQTDYMKLLITQLQNQNPLEPLNNNEMASQLAQFSQLQQLESMNTNFADVLTTAQRTYANSLIGKEISFETKDDFGTTDVVSAPVQQVLNNVEGDILLMAGENRVTLDDVISVKN